MKPAIPLLEAAREVQLVFEDIGAEPVLIGGLAIFRWGEPRLTRNIDSTMVCPYGAEAQKVRAVLARLRGRIPDARSGTKSCSSVIHRAVSSPALPA